jgi:hypothetical protein
MLSTNKWLGRMPWLLIAVMLLAFPIARAQNITANLSGIATDQTDARIPGAMVVVKNEASGDRRDTKSDSQGFWSVTALIPGSYSVTISAKGFSPWEETGVVLNQGDSRTVANIHLKIGSESAAVTVISGADAEVPVDTAEVSAQLNNELVDSAILTGRGVGELVKLMPGVTFNNGGGAGSNFGNNGISTGTNNGPAGTFSANGTQPYGSTALMLDGAMITDPGNAGTQVANMNQDMTDSVKFMSASYGAEYAKGPAVLQAFSKSGGQRFHGEGYLYARNSALGFANDWNNKSQELASGQKNSIAPASYYYAGGNVGGPIFFPGFNRNKDKLFFWAGYEKMIQHPYVALVDMNVPTADQLAGNFDNSAVPTGVKNTYANAYALPCNTDNGWQGCNAGLSPWVGYGTGPVPNLKQYFDPIGTLVTALEPQANVTPNSSNGWNNYAFQPVTPQDRYEVTAKINYNLSDNNKIWGSWTQQVENDAHPQAVWWAPAYTIPSPAKPVGVETAHVYLLNFTHVFSSSTTNEFVFADAIFENNVSLSKPTENSRKTLGFPQESIFAGHGTDSMPDFEGGWGDGVPWIGNISQMHFDGGIYGKGTFGKTSKAPNLSDTFTKILGTHSIKAGMYWDTDSNLQSSGGINNAASNGTFQNAYSYSGNDTYNPVLDRMIGRLAAYNEENITPNAYIQTHQWSLWAQDSWKFNRKLTLNYGLRADHIGQWYAPGGSETWDPALYQNVANAPANSGITWHSLTSNVPLSGWASKLFTYNPRLGAAYDLFGTGKTVIRGGFGIYQYQLSGNDGGNAVPGAQGAFTYGTSNVGSIAGIFGYNIANGTVQAVSGGGAKSTTTVQLAVPNSSAQNGTNVTADKLGDSKIPYADTWSFGVAQALPSHTVMEVSYVGSASRNQYLSGSTPESNIDQIPYQGFYKMADPIQGGFWNPSPCGPIYNASKILQPGGCPNNPAGDNFAGATGSPTNNPPNYSVSGVSGFNANDYKPSLVYTGITTLTHGGYANYNSLQVSAQKQSGNLYVFSSFTFGKVLGTRDGDSSNGNGNGSTVDNYSLRNNYAQLAYDHTKTFNVSFSYKLPKPIHGNPILAGAINGWQLTGYTTYEDGAPYQSGNVNMNATYDTLGQSPKVNDRTKDQVFNIPGADQTWVGGNQTQSISTSTWFGTNLDTLMPVVVCDPRKGLAKGQYFNPNCFRTPMGPTSTSIGEQGQTVWPYIRYPHYVGSDLAVFKAFRITDAQRVEIRISATNWLNHPNGQFGLNGNSDNSLLFYGASTGSNTVLNSNASTTGIPAARSGYRWMQWAAKYYF